MAFAACVVSPGLPGRGNRVSTGKRSSTVRENAITMANETKSGASPQVIPRRFPEGRVPVISAEGDARECGRQYAEIVRERYPGYRRYLDTHGAWFRLETPVKRLIERRAPHLMDLFQGVLDGDEPRGDTLAPAAEGCSSFGVSGDVTLDGQPLSGQTKDTIWKSAELYIVLRMRIRGAPSILVLAYPGEVMGYGLWSNGMSLFRNSLYSTPSGSGALDGVRLGMLGLASESADEAAELARTHGVRDSGHYLFSDGEGRSVCVEWNAGGVGVIPAEDGVATHANHPVGAETQPLEDYPDGAERLNSYHRQDRLRELLLAESGRLTPQKAMMAMADHSRYPLGLCRHTVGGSPDQCTTAAVVAEPTRGRLHVTRGQPCSNWPTTYDLEEDSPCAD